MFVNGYEVVVFHSGKKVTVCKTTDYEIALDIHQKLEKVFGDVRQYESSSDYTVSYSMSQIEPTTLYIALDDEEEL